MILKAAIKCGDDVHSLPRPCRHKHILEMLRRRGIRHGQQGFIDSQRGFVNRTEAAKIAQAEGQVGRLKRPKALQSEDLW